MEKGTLTAMLRLVLGKVWEFLCYIIFMPIRNLFGSLWTRTHSEYYSWRINEEMMKQGMSDAKASKVHWTRTRKRSTDEQQPHTFDIKANEELFESHMKKPWGRFFVKMDSSTVISEKPIAEGGQAKIFLETQVSGKPKTYMGRTQHLLKVYKRQRSLQLLLEQGMPKGMLQEHVLTRQRLNEVVETSDGGIPELRTVFTSGRPSTQTRMHRCNISHVVLLKDGRLAFRLAQYSADLRTFIDRLKMKDNHSPPFTDDVAALCMLQIAMGMRDLHNDDIVHCDLKASNVLVSNSLHGLEPVEQLRAYPLYCWLADFECSVGCFGTGFWNAPEILRYLKLGPPHEEEEVLEDEEALKEEVVTEEKVEEEKDPDEDDLKFLKEKDPNDKELEEITKHFTKKSDVYSYAITCYEILTGLTPFEREQYHGRRKVEEHEVFNPPYKRPQLPSDTKPWMRDLLEKCWNQDPLERPTFEEIVRIIEEAEPSSKERVLRLWTHSR